MKKFPLHLIIFAVAIFLAWMPLKADAASIDLSTIATQVHAGENFKVIIAINPLGEKMFTVKAALSYPADLLRVVSFNFGDVWMPLNQPGYNEINNEKGMMVKTGGYPDGISLRTTLGVITFIGLKEGSGAVKVSDDSVVLNSESKNILMEKGVTVLTLLPARTTISPAKGEPATKNAKGVIVSDRYTGTNLPENIPSPDKVWLYTKLAILSVIALILQYKVVMYLLVGILVYILFRVIRRIVER